MPTPHAHIEVDAGASLFGIHGVVLSSSCCFSSVWLCFHRCHQLMFIRKSNSSGPLVLALFCDSLGTDDFSHVVSSFPQKFFGAEAWSHWSSSFVGVGSILLHSTRVASHKPGPTGCQTCTSGGEPSCSWVRTLPCQDLFLTIICYITPQGQRLRVLVQRRRVLLSHGQPWSPRKAQKASLAIWNLRRPGQGLGGDILVHASSLSVLPMLLLRLVGLVDFSVFLVAMRCFAVLPLNVLSVLCCCRRLVGCVCVCGGFFIL